MIASQPDSADTPQEPSPSLAAVRAMLKREGAGPKPPNYLREVLRYMGQEQRALIFILATALLEALLSLVSPWISSRAIDMALPNSAPSMLTLLAVGIVAAIAFTAWAGWLHERASVVLQERLVSRAQRELMERYLKTGFADLQTTEFGPTRVTFSAASVLVQTVTRAVADVTTLSATAVATLIMLGLYSVGLAGSILVASLVTACIAALLSFREMHFASHNMGANSQAEQMLHVLLRAVTTLRAFHATDRLVGRWLERCGAQAQQAVGLETTRLARAALLLGARQLITWTTTLWLVNQAMAGAISLGAMISCTMLVSHVLGATVGVTQSVLSVFVQRPITKRVDALYTNSQQGSAARVSAKTYTLRSQGVQVRHVWYRYHGAGPWVLQGYSEDFASGRYTVLRAASGSGKSTLLRLIAGLLTPDHGRVLVCGRDPSATSDLVAYVPQQSLLLDASIAVNLNMLSGGRLEQALAVAPLTGLARLLERLPMGPETLISGAGGNLSAGQRQLVTLTAAFATEQPVLLLDEAASQLDARSRGLVQWDALSKGRTVIAVQHT